MRELPKDYFLGVDDELVDYLENKGKRRYERFIFLTKPMLRMDTNF